MIYCIDNRCGIVVSLRLRTGGPEFDFWGEDEYLFQVLVRLYKSLGMLHLRYKRNSSRNGCIGVVIKTTNCIIFYEFVLVTTN